MLPALLLMIQVASPDAPPSDDARVGELNRAARAPSDAAIAKFDREQARYRESDAAFRAAQARYQADTAAYQAAMQSYRAGVAASEAATLRWQADAARRARSRPPTPTPRAPAAPDRRTCTRETATGSNMPRIVCRDRN